MRHAIFLSGPVGAGKTTLGRALSERLAAGFIDGDDFSAPGRPWYCSILQTSRAIVRHGMAELDEHGAVVIAYPLNCINWIYFRRKFGDGGAAPLFISLRASYDAIVAPSRGRIFDDGELARIRTMLAEGYDQRPFSDLIFDTDQAGFVESAARLHQLVNRMMCRQVTSSPST